MSTLKKLLLLSLALVLSFTLVASVGCKELSQEEIDQIVAGAIAAHYDTVSFNMEVPLTLTVTGGSNPGGVTMLMAGSGVMDINAVEMQITMTMAADVTEIGEQLMEMEAYVVDGWMYTGTKTPGESYAWVKMEMTPELWQQQLAVEQQIELLETAVDISYDGTATLNGVECYVFKIEPDMEEIDALLTEELSGLGFDFSGVDLSDFYKEIVVKEWLAKDSYLVMKSEFKAVVEISAEEVGATADDFDKMNMDIEMNMNFYDYNQPVSIILPDEALNAEEVSY